MSKEKLYIFDTTLRDGAQTQGVDFSIDDKIKIAEALDRLGVDYIEGGWPGANPTDTEFFQKNIKFNNSKFVNTYFHDVSFRNAEIIDGYFEKPIFIDVDFSNADLKGTVINEATMIGDIVLNCKNNQICK